MMHNRTKATDSAGAVVRVVLFDYRKAFDFIDHTLLARKVINLSIAGSDAYTFLDRRTTTCDVTWNDHVSETIKKANKRLYFLVLLNRADVSPCDFAGFYRTVVRPGARFSNVPETFRARKAISKTMKPFMYRAFNVNRFCI